MIQAATFEEATRVADAAMARMRADQVPPTPVNYAVFYAWKSGSFPDLARTMDILASNGQPFTDERCHDLYRKFIGGDADARAIQGVGDQLQGAVDNVLAALQAAGADVGRYGEALARFDGQLELGRTLDQLRVLVHSVASETARIAASNQTLQSRLTDSASRIEQMRHDLDQVRREAMTDALTGLANRKMFDQSLRDAAAQAMEHGKPLSLLMIDIDHFKKFNDSHGHVSGDQVLKLVGRTLTENVKGRDTPARYGGEEFAIVMPSTELADAATVAEQIRKAVASRKIIKRTTGECLGTITLSIGVARFRPGESLGRFVGRADAALYAAKNGGRNRVQADAEDADARDAAAGK